MTPRRWFERHAVNRHTENACRDLMEDLNYAMGLSPYLHNERGALSVCVDDGHGGRYVISDGAGNLPDGTQIVLGHVAAGCHYAFVLRVIGSGSILDRAAASLAVTRALSAGMVGVAPYNEYYEAV